MISIVKRGPIQDTRCLEIVIGSAADAADLPTPNSSGERAVPGSVAYTQDLEHVYLLGPDGVWREAGAAEDAASADA